MWQNLIDIIQTLVEIYAQLFVLNEKKRKAVLDIDMHTLEGLIKEEQAIINSIITAEQTRKNILKTMAVNNSPINEHSNVKNLLHFCPQEYKDSFLKVNNDLSASVQKVSSISEANKLLMQGALTAVNMNINSLAGIKADPGYGKNGTQNFSPHEKNFELKI